MIGGVRRRSGADVSRLLTEPGVFNPKLALCPDRNAEKRFLWNNAPRLWHALVSDGWLSKYWPLSDDCGYCLADITARGELV